jgi:hypothetical protein
VSLDVWYPDDVRRILIALASAGILQGPGYHKALGDVALAFGLIECELIIVDIRRHNDNTEAYLPRPRGH